MKKGLSYPGMGRGRLDSERAEQMAMEVLGFLADDLDRLGRFFDVTGLTIQSVRAAATQPGFEASLMAYLGSDEALLCAFAAQKGYDPAEVDAARRVLAGPDHD